MFNNGKVLFTANKKVAMNADCCCGEPCDGCEGDSPNATVTVAGGGCPSKCTSAAGDYTIFNSLVDANCCTWNLLGPIADYGRMWGLNIRWAKAQKKWRASVLFWLVGSGGLNDKRSFGGLSGDLVCGGTDVNDSLDCLNGNIEGTFSLPGDNLFVFDPRWADCSLCTATVVVT